MKIIENLSKREFYLLCLSLTSIILLGVFAYYAFTYFELTDSLMRGQKVYLERLLELETDENYRTFWNLTLNIVNDYENIFPKNDVFQVPILGDKP